MVQLDIGIIFVIGILLLIIGIVLGFKYYKKQIPNVKWLLILIAIIVIISAIKLLINGEFTAP